MTEGSSGAPDRATPAAAVPFPPGIAATLVLVRHGQSQWLAEGRFQGAGDTPLSPLGLRQAALAGTRLASPGVPPRLPVPDGDPAFIAHSPLLRTTETAAAVAAAIVSAGREAPPMVADPGFAEIAQGAWEGEFQRDVESRWAAEIAAWRLDPVHNHAPGGESLAEVDVRVRAGLARVLARLAAAEGAVDPPGAAPRSPYDPHAGPWAVIAGHDGAFKVATLALLGLPLSHFWSFTQVPTGIGVIEIRNSRAIVRAWNRTDHLAELERSAGEAERRAEDEAAARARSGAL